RLSRLHNDANVLVLGGRLLGKGLVQDMIDTWLNTEFEGGRHQARLDKISEIEDNWSKGEC
ncbi:MAG: RpiB/LacA/LacB family sugar-phosphate isomerase, partial [Nitrospinae bacterium]|nr:RpiB/LacA/LacB family sugar-phosphate isomerase [Nitrospinota bacterium]